MMVFPRKKYIAITFLCGSCITSIDYAHSMDLDDPSTSLKRKSTTQNSNTSNKIQKTNEGDVKGQIKNEEEPTKVDKEIKTTNSSTSSERTVPTVKKETSNKKRKRDSQSPPHKKQHMMKDISNQSDDDSHPIFLLSPDATETDLLEAASQLYGPKNDAPDSRANLSSGNNNVPEDKKNIKSITEEEIKEICEKDKKNHSLTSTQIDQLSTLTNYLVEKIKKSQNKFKHQLKDNNNTLVFIVGDTGSGKTTLTQWLLGKELVAKKDLKNGKKLILEEKNVEQKAKIGHEFR